MSATIDAAISAGLSVSVTPQAGGFLVHVGRGTSNARIAAVEANIVDPSMIDATVTTLRARLKSESPPLPSQSELDEEASSIEAALRSKYPSLANVQVVLRRAGGGN